MCSVGFEARHDGTLLPTPFRDLTSQIVPVDLGFDERGWLILSTSTNIEIVVCTQ